jgi:hypothetical protein
MSRTYNTRPIRIIEEDPAMEKFKMVGSMYWPEDATSEHFWRKINSCSCWGCGNKKAHHGVKRTARVRWRSTRQKSLARVRAGDYDIDVAPEKYRY